MAYIPLSRIKTNLYTNGNEFVVSTTKEDYIGFYYKTFNGACFTGSSPSTNQNVELLPVTTFSENKQNTKKLPVYYAPILTQEDYTVGQIQRYFAKKINQVEYIEIEKQVYQAMSTFSPFYYWQNYIVFMLPWQITGNKNVVATTNKQIVELTEKTHNLKGLTLYLNNTLEFYIEK